MNEPGFQDTVVRGFRDTLRVLREHLLVDALLVAGAVVVGASLFYRGYDDGDSWKSAVVLPALLGLGPIVVGSGMVGAVQLRLAPSRIRNELASAEFHGAADSAGRDAMCGYLRDLLADPRLCVQHAVVFGSSIVAHPPPRDVDVAVVIGNVSQRGLRKIFKRLRGVAEEFRHTTGYPLHIERFLSTEPDRIESFLTEASPQLTLIGSEKEPDGQEP